MKSCRDCKYAEWDRTSKGRLHPSGSGRCTFKVKVPPLPASMYWIGTTKPAGGYINRQGELLEHCAYYARQAQP